MAEWPAIISKRFFEKQGESTPPGESISVTPTRNQDETLHSYIVLCPKCGLLGDCPVSTPEKPANSTNSRGEVNRCWEAHVDDSGHGRKLLTLSPSILCSCGGHYWLTDGVLREV